MSFRNALGVKVQEQMIGKEAPLVSVDSFKEFLAEKVKTRIGKQKQGGILAKTILFYG